MSFSGVSQRSSAYLEVQIQPVEEEQDDDNHRQRERYNDANEDHCRDELKNAPARKIYHTSGGENKVKPVK